MMTALRDPGQLSGHVLVFDSGIGGLTVRAELLEQAPKLRVDYAADTAFFPYGDKADDALKARLPRVISALVNEIRPDVCVIACNTASTLALEPVREAVDVPVVGTVPAIKPAAALSRSNVIGLLATPGTLRRQYTADLIAQFAAETTVISHGSVELVRLAEAAASGAPITPEELVAAQAPLFDQAESASIDTVVLACTHFPLLRAGLVAAAPRPMAYIDSGAAIARQTLRILSSLDIGPPIDRRPVGLMTDSVGQGAFEQVLKRFGVHRFEHVLVPK